MDVKLLKIEYPIKHVAVETFESSGERAQSAPLSETSLVFDWLSDKDEVRASTDRRGEMLLLVYIKERVGAKKQRDHWQNSRRAREAYHSILVPKAAIWHKWASVRRGLALAASCIFY